MHYRLLVSIEVIEFIERLSAKTREALRWAIHAIGRRIHIAVVGDYAPMYWVDEADQHIKILDIHASDL